MREKGKNGTEGEGSAPFHLCRDSLLPNLDRDPSLSLLPSRHPRFPLQPRAVDLSDRGGSDGSLVERVERFVR